MEGYTVTKKAIIIYLLFAFSLAWILWGLVALLEGTAGDAVAQLVGAIVMWTPAAAVLITKKLCGGTRIIEPSFKPKFNGNKRLYVFAWLAPFAVSILGGILYYCIFPYQLEPGIVISDSAVLTAFFSRALILLTVNTIILVPLALGEEIGWRGFLFPALRRRSTEVKTHILCGIIWGLWHAPPVAMGHNYGIGYIGYPWLGILAMCVTITGTGIFLSYITGKTGSIWPAALGHGANNAVSSLSTFFLRKDFPLSEGFNMGVIVVLPYLFLGIVLLMVNARKIKS